ncbi:hypothetical protein [Streptomyces sp. SCL15-4]|uniref:hypothetical protein n=1 Tax=Streptomyces sp. SCL15-4 TaxID=2967221 RepID=UPI0029671E01|nr:hypothetical protein [Streptomyces sp. SCL15-4]
MRDLPVRRLASTVLCASVLVGITGPVALAADTAGEHGRTASRASVPAAEKDRLLTRARALGRTHPELGPVAELLSRSLEEGRLPAGEAARLGEAAKEAITRAAGTAGVPRPVAPAEPAAQPQPAPAVKPAAPASPAGPASPAAPVTVRHASAGAPMARDVLDDTIGALLTAIDDLVKSITDEAAAAQTAADQITADQTAADQTAADQTAADQTAADESDQMLPSFDGLLSGLFDLLTGLFGTGGSGLAVSELPTTATPALVPGLAPTG